MMDLKFKNTWNVWYHHILNDWTLSGYNKIYTINNIKDFWDFYININLIEELNNLHLYFMRDNVTPIWEDNNNMVYHHFLQLILQLFQILVFLTLFQS